MIVSHRGAELFCTSRGQGPVCLLLSAIGTVAYERQLPAALSERLKLVFVDPRGAGRSSGDATELSFDQLAEDLEAVRRALGAETVAVFGHSIVGALAIEYARRCPRVVSSVVTVGMPPCGEMARVAAAAQVFFDEDASRERKRILAENLGRLPAGAPPGLTMYAETPKRFFDPRFDAAPLFAGAEARPAFFAHLFGELTPGWEIAAGETPHMPWLHIHGRYDYVVPHRLWDELRTRLPTLSFELFERSSHQPFVDEPERFVEVVTEFLSPRFGCA